MFYRKDKISLSQKILLKNMMNDSLSNDSNYKPGPYWEYDCNKSYHLIRKNGFNNFRGKNCGIASGYADNIRIDNSSEYHPKKIKSIIANKIRNFPWIYKLFDTQVKITEVYLEEYLKYLNYHFANHMQVKYLLSKYRVKNDLNFDCKLKFEYNGNQYSISYLETLNLIDQINKKIDLNGATSFFEIGPGFGSNIHLLIENFNIKKFVILDVVPNLFICTEYLRSLYGKAVIDYISTRNKKIKFKNDNNLEILCIAPWQIKDLDMHIDVFHNSMSFQEMSLESVKNYARYLKSFGIKKYSLNFYDDSISSNLRIKIKEVINCFDVNFNYIKYNTIGIGNSSNQLYTNI